MSEACVQVNQKELELEEKRETLYLKNIEKLYASVKKTTASIGGDSYFKAGGNFSPYPKPSFQMINDPNTNV